MKIKFKIFVILCCLFLKNNGFVLDGGITKSISIVGHICQDVYNKESKIEKNLYGLGFIIGDCASATGEAFLISYALSEFYRKDLKQNQSIRNIAIQYFFISALSHILKNHAYDAYLDISKKQ